MENLDLARILDMLRCRIWIAAPLFTSVLVGATGLAYFLPNVYRASAFVMVEGQQIPEEYVRSTVTTDIQNRLHSISQEILSRSRLEQLIREYNLYQTLAAEAPFESVILAMRRDIGIEIKNVDAKRGRGREAVAFEISYIGTDPRKVTLVANRLASFYIEENLKLRERQAIGTKDFLADQLREIKEQLEQQEQRVAAFKREHLGELPQQLDANLKTLERLQQQMQLTSDNLAKARERRDLLQREMDQYRQAVQRSDEAGQEGKTVIPAGTAATDIDKQIEELSRTLAILKARFSDRHPDIIRTEETLAGLKEEQKARGAVLSADGTEREGPVDPFSSRLKSDLREVDAEIRFLTADLGETRKLIGVYQKRIETTPQREQELSSLSRDYDSTRELYSSLLKRREEAELATTMEQRQKAERFRILDPAVFPQRPEGPNRMRILLMGLVLGLGLGGGGVFVRELLDDSFHRVEDLQNFAQVPLLVSIPLMRTRTDLWRRRLRHSLAACTLIILLVGVAGTSYLIAAGNEPLVKRFTGSAGGLKIR